MLLAFRLVFPACLHVFGFLAISPTWTLDGTKNYHYVPSCWQSKLDDSPPKFRPNVYSPPLLSFVDYSSSCSAHQRIQSLEATVDASHSSPPAYDTVFDFQPISTTFYHFAVIRKKCHAHPYRQSVPADSLPTVLALLDSFAAFFRQRIQSREATFDDSHSSPPACGTVSDCRPTVPTFYSFPLKQSTFCDSFYIRSILGGEFPTYHSTPFDWLLPCSSLHYDSPSLWTFRSLD
mmetsp:Transcript_19354/g.30273  ORF Transcript_19354/g.30273 Transcript_19354/m.30273 type:complete len:234 (+) Transcript_19354:493-1194(+)